LTASVLKRVFLYLLKGASLLLAVSVVTFMLMSLSPIDPVQVYVGAGTSISPEQHEAIAQYWGLHEPPAGRFLAWLGALLRGDLGTSLIFRLPVSQVIAERALDSLALMATAWLLAGFIGFALGTLAGAYHGHLPDQVIKSFCLALSSTPPFWLGLILMMAFAAHLQLLPIGLAVPAGKLAADVTFFDRLRHMILPALTLSIVGLPTIALHTRQKLIEVLHSDYCLFAFARGQGKWAIIRRHGLRNTLLPAVTLQFASFAELFGGSVLAEQVFSYPGLGRTAVQAGLQGDMPLLLGITLFSALFVFIGNSIANALYGIFNPEIRSGSFG